MIVAHHSLTPRAGRGDSQRKPPIGVNVTVSCQEFERALSEPGCGERSGQIPTEFRIRLFAAAHEATLNELHAGSSAGDGTGELFSPLIKKLGPGAAHSVNR
jgi:hypothetical protein